MAAFALALAGCGGGSGRVNGADQGAASAESSSTARVMPAALAAAPATGTGLSAAYYANARLYGNSVLSRIEVPWFDWGSSSPAPSLPADNFSVRWTGEVEAIEAGNYQFQVTSDDGVRVWVDGVLLIDNWTAHSATTDTSGLVKLNAGQRVSIVIEYQELGGNAVLKLAWQRPGRSWEPVPAARLYPAVSASGLTGRYYGNRNLDGPALLTRIDTPWFDWGYGAPAPNVPADNFSVRWIGEVQAMEGGTYQFRTTSDDGVRVWVGGTRVIDNWTSHPATTNTTGLVKLNAGQRVPIVIEYQDTGGHATIQLGWLRPGGTWSAVPSTQLYPDTRGPQPMPPAHALNCAQEYGNCMLPPGSVATVWFGAETGWAVKTGVTGGIACNSDTFGDPLQTGGKSCRYLLTGSVSNTAAVANANFEARVLGNGEIAVGAPVGWTGGTGTYNPSAAWYGPLASTPIVGTMAGANVAYLWGAGAPALQQITGTRAVAGATYWLTVALGGRTSGGVFAGAAIDLLADGAVVATRSVTSVPVPGSFGDVSVGWTVPSTSAGAVLGIRIRALVPGDSRYVDVDNVRLSYSSATASTASAAVPVSEDCMTKRDTAGADVVLLMGQSNMSGYGHGYDPAIDGPLHPRVQQWSRANAQVTASEHLEHADHTVGATSVGMGTAFGRAWLATLPAQRQVLLVPTAFGGTSLVNGPWSPGGNLFEDAVARLGAALASNTGNCVAAVLWHQGEADVFNRVSAAAYRSALTNMIATLRTRVPRAAHAPFVLGEFVPEWTAQMRGGWPVEDILQALHDVPGLVNYSAVASSSGLASNGSPDIIHFSAAGQRAHAQRYFEAVAAALKK